MEDLEGYIAFAKNNRWSDRQERGLPYKMDVYDFLEQFYLPWIAKGITRADIKRHEESLWWGIQNRLRDKKPMPEKVFIPKDADIPFNQAATPEERIKIEGRREYFRKTQARYQAGIRAQRLNKD